MKKSCRARVKRLVKWGGVAVCVGVVGVWAGSGRWYVVYGGPSGEHFSVSRGWIAVGRMTLPPGSMLGWDRGVNPEPGFDWSYFAARLPGGGSLTIVPLWMPFVPVLIVTGVAWWVDAVARRRARVGLCRTCGYDLRGLEAGVVCPECGVGGVSKGGCV